MKKRANSISLANNGQLEEADAVAKEAQVEAEITQQQASWVEKQVIGQDYVSGFIFVILILCA